MRVLNNLHDSFLDFVDHNRYGNSLFYIARALLFAMVVMVGSKVAAGQFLSFGFGDVLFMACAAITFLLVAVRWEIGIALIIASTAFIFHFNVIPTLSLYHFVPELRWLEPYRLLMGQGIVVFLIFLFLTSREVATMRDRLTSPLSYAVLIFLSIVFLASVWGVVFGGVYFPKMVQAARPYSFYLTFFVALLCVRKPENLRSLLVILSVMAVIVALGMTLQFFSGDRVRIFIGAGIRVESFGRFAGRVLPPGIDLIWQATTMMIALIPVFKGATRKWMMLALSMVALGLLLTFTRAMWMGALAGVLFMVLRGDQFQRSGILRIFLVFALSIFMLLMLLGAISTQSENYLSAYVERFTSTFKSESYSETSTVGARMVEIKAAWLKIMEHPWIGIGLGADYNREVYYDVSRNTFIWRGISYIHNMYVLILCKTGIAGLISMLAMLGVFFSRARVIQRVLTSDFDRAFVLGAQGTTISIIVGSLLQPSMAVPGSVSLLAFIWGSMELLRYWQQRGSDARLSFPNSHSTKPQFSEPRNHPRRAQRRL